jgi:hypothetical protein
MSDFKNNSMKWSKRIQNCTCYQYKKPTVNRAKGFQMIFITNILMRLNYSFNIVKNISETLE